MTILEEVLTLFDRRGRDQYHGESVSQTEHALQAAALAEASGAADPLVVAALLHDVGHLLDEPEDLAERGVDGHHEEAGASWLARAFGPAVAEPVRLHVAAKRYLCSTDPSYLGELSEASVLSLKVQGGPLGDSEIAAFQALPYAADALKLRRWDDAAKVPGLVVPELSRYRSQIESASLGAERRTDGASGDL